ncbi:MULTISPECIES: copper resistance protein B [Asticcacaulis]|uniref:copper resistance protein B n=1 Tax=Asticcacaulis TaxID=76890 RepID=UPI001FDAA402|nr:MULTISPECIES: copper resistance protein B [Asticcacaulis]MBP2159004.1 copper resistance protein B [Asticcacaulis solisilvae]MDR6800049.1 copper resistance protein B [Asticcacaulis sp. BE141]
MIIAAAPLLFALPAAAQDHSGMQGMSMPGMQMPAAKPAPAAKKTPAKKPTAKKTVKRAAGKKTPAKASDPTPAAGSGAMSTMPGMDMAGQMDMGKVDAKDGAAKPDPMSGMNMGDKSMAGMDMGSAAASNSPGDSGMGNMSQNQGGMSGMEMPGPNGEESIPMGPPPAAPAERVADRFFGKGEMDRAETQLRKEHGGATVSKVMLNLAEYQSGSSGSGYRWSGEAWYGGDLNRFVAKTEGMGSSKEGVSDGEVQALYSRAIGVYTDLQVGVRYDFAPTPTRTYLTVGTETLLPFWLENENALFLSNKGEVMGRSEIYYDLRLTQRWILQTRGEVNLAAQNSPEIGIGSGISNAELGFRLRYEIKRNFGPYVGVSFDQKFGKTADYAKLAGEKTHQTSFVVGLRTFF